MDEYIKSPCIRICSMDSRTGLCSGCLRTIDEISEWVFLSDDDKRKLFVELERRRANIRDLDKHKDDTDQEQISQV